MCGAQRGTASGKSGTCCACQAVACAACATPSGGIKLGSEQGGAGLAPHLSLSTTMVTSSVLPASTAARPSSSAMALQPLDARRLQMATASSLLRRGANGAGQECKH